MGFKYNDERKETGVDVTVEFAGEEYAVTSASFSEEADTSEVQFNDSYSKDIAITGVTFSGSFEISGRVTTDQRNEFYDSGQSNEDRLSNLELPKHLETGITFKEQGDNAKTYEFKNVLITSHEKDVPSDDRTTESFDFSAEELIKS